MSDQYHTFSRENPLSEKQRKAAALIVIQGMTRVAVCKKLKMSRSTIWEWEQTPEFRAELNRLMREMERRMLHLKIAQKSHRLQAINKRWIALHEVIRCRSNDPECLRAPGGETGLVVRKLKDVGGAAVEEFEVDTGLLAEIRACEMQAAKELGQHNPDTVVNTTVNVDASQNYDLTKLSVPELEILRSTLTRATSEPHRN